MKKFAKTTKELALFLLIAFAPMTGLAADPEAEKAAILKADAAWLATSKSGADFIGFTDPDFTFFPPGAPFMSVKEEMIEHWDSIVNTPGLELIWGPNGAVVSKDGDLGYSYGWYKLTTVDDDGETKEATGKYVTVMRKQPSGEWRPLVDIFNSN